LALLLKGPADTLLDIRDRFKRRRLAMNLTQSGLAKRSGVALGSLKRFEQTGLIAFDSLLKIALVLNCLADFDNVCVEDVQALSSKSLDQVLAAGKARKKGQLK
jgi:transcriptional regulator with XRE-family HTH domain